ncbi:MAG: hypothetical protein K2P79_01420 [Sphingomonas sp.]|nr:hypothetical protein [Sphingomonas sp.]
MENTSGMQYFQWPCSPSGPALTFARKRRIGPFAATLADRPQREKQLAAMLRGGHDFDTARRIVAMEPGDDVAMLGENC